MSVLMFFPVNLRSHYTLVKIWPRYQFNVETCQGFTVVEAFVGLMITMISLTIALQMFVSAAYLRSQSSQFNDAYNWIREDFETVRSKAAVFERGAIPYSSRCGASAAGNLAAAFIQDPAVGLGGELVTLGSTTIDGQQYQLTRMADYLGTIAPERLVGLRYKLISLETGNTVSEVDAEVVMYAAFRCPF